MKIAEPRSREYLDRQSKRRNCANADEAAGGPSAAGPFAPYVEAYRNSSLSIAEQFTLSHRLLSISQGDSAVKTPRLPAAKELLSIANDSRTALYVREGVFRLALESVDSASLRPQKFGRLWMEHAQNFAQAQDADKTVALRTLLALFNAFYRCDSPVLPHLQRAVYSCMRDIVRSVPLQTNDVYRIADAFAATVCVDRPMYEDAERRQALSFIVDYVLHHAPAGPQSATLMYHALDGVRHLRGRVSSRELFQLQAATLRLLRTEGIESPVRAALLKKVLETLLRERPEVAFIFVRDVAAAAAKMHPLCTVPPCHLAEIYSGALTYARPFGARLITPSAVMQRYMQPAVVPPSVASHTNEIHSQISTIFTHARALLDRDAVDAEHGMPMIRAAAEYAKAHAGALAESTLGEFFESAQAYQARRTSGA